MDAHDEPNPEVKPIPETLIECFRIIESEVAPKDIKAFKKMGNARSSDWSYSMSWPLYLRNRFIHPHHSPIRKKFEKLGFWLMPDGMSTIMKGLFLGHLNGQELDANAVWEILDKESIIFSQMGNKERYLPIIEDLWGKYEP